jgi:hypothetical protein
MKKMLYILILMGIIISCENRIEIVNAEDPRKEILDSCFISAIKFDNSGTAWVGTFQKGLLTYKNGTVEYLNSKYPVLPSTIVDIQIDSKGNLWLAYGNGIIKYDGSTFTKYNASNTPLSDYPVTSIAIDQNDHIWFTSCIFKSGGIARYDGTNWTTYTPENSPLPVSFVQSIAVDGNNNIWLAASQIVNECYLIKISGSTWKVYNKNDFGFTPYYFSKIAVNSNNEVFCGIDYSYASTLVNNGAGLLKFNGTSFDRIDLDDYFIVKSIKIDKSDKIWCGDWSGKNKYGVFYGQSWVYNGEGLTESVVTAIGQAPDGKMWLGTESGLHIVPNSTVNVSSLVVDF